MLCEFEEKDSHGIIMPVKKQIKRFLELPNVFERIINNQSQVEQNGNYRNIIDGSLWKKIVESFQGKYVIPLFLYNDDFQPDSSVSPHSSSGKLGAYYYSFPTLPDYLATNLKNIFIAILVKVKEVDVNDVVSQEFDPALFALFEIFADLEKHGINLKINGKMETVYVVLPQFLGDNLAVNGSLGFPKGFTAIYICRICLMPKDIREKATGEILELLRNKDNYEDCLKGKRRDERKGVKYNCVLNYLEHFKVYENFSVDIMHDGHLGVFKMDIHLILLYYIVKKETFSLDVFNAVKKKFAYGNKQKGNKTADITEPHLNNGLQMNAKEVWTLVEFLPLMLLPLVTNYEDCPSFKFVLKMNEVLDSISKSSFTEADILEMDRRISDHHRMFIDLSRIVDSHLIPQHFQPKFHTMLHYGTIVRLAGPLKKSMVFRFEQKHQELKQYARACYSRVNLPYSICTKFSLEAARLFMDKRDIFTIIKEVVFKNEIQIQGSYPNTVSKPIQKLRYKAVEYELNDLIYHNSIAYKVEEMVQDMNKDEIYIYARKLECEFISNLGFYKVLNESMYSEVIKISNLMYAPVNITKVLNNFYFKVKFF